MCNKWWRDIKRLQQVGLLWTILKQDSKVASYTNPAAGCNDRV